MKSIARPSSPLENPRCRRAPDSAKVLQRAASASPGSRFAAATGPFFVALLLLPLLACGPSDEVLARAEQGDAGAQLAIGDRLATPSEAQDLGVAVAWYEKAAEQGIEG